MVMELLEYFSLKAETGKEDTTVHNIVLLEDMICYEENGKDKCNACA